VLHAYIPDRAGKERRKQKAGKEGKLGVEGMDAATLREALRRAGATFCESGTDMTGETPQSKRKLTKAHLFEAGLTGTIDSKSRRQALLKTLDLPENLTTNGLLEMLNVLYSFEEGLRVIEE